MNEIWKDIEGWEGLYQVSNLGKVKSLPRYHDAKHPYITKERILKPRFCGKTREYLSVSLNDNCEVKQMKVHRLVAQAFVPNPKGHKEINHINEDKSDNRAENLEWCSRSYNVNYGKRIEKQRVHLLIPVRQITLGGEFIRDFPSIIDAGDSLGIHPSNISKVVNGDRKTAGGFIWEKK